MPTQTNDEPARPEGLTDAERIAAIDARYSGDPEFARVYQTSAQDLLARGHAVDLVVKEMAALIVESVEWHEHPVDRAAAALWALGRLPGWVFTPRPDGA